MQNYRGNKTIKTADLASSAFVVFYQILEFIYYGLLVNLFIHIVHIECIVLLLPLALMTVKLRGSTYPHCSLPSRCVPLCSSYSMLNKESPNCINHNLTVLFTLCAINTSFWFFFSRFSQMTMDAVGAEFLSSVLPSLKNLKILRWQMSTKFYNKSLFHIL